MKHLNYDVTFNVNDATNLRTFVANDINRSPIISLIRLVAQIIFISLFACGHENNE